MNVEVHRCPSGVRACAFSLCLQDGCVFADFDIDPDRRVFLVRISFDGYGCCAPKNVGRLPAGDSAALRAMVERDDVGGAVPLLRRYFTDHRALLWDDALSEHGLVE